MFLKIGALKNFAIFTEKQLCRSLNFGKIAGQACSFKACVCYFLTNVYFSPNDSHSKTMKDVFYFNKKALFILKILKFLYFHLPLFFSLSAITLDLIQDKS